MKCSQVCEYVRYGEIGSGACVVHLRCTTNLQQKRKRGGPERGRLASREPGDFLCGKNKLVEDKLQVVTRDEFLLEPCHKCVARAEQFELEVEDFSNIPGPRVKLYTTSPPERDRPYVRRGEKPIGNYSKNPVWELLVPEDTQDITLRWCKRDRWYAWTQTGWDALIESGVAERE